MNARGINQPAALLSAVTMVLAVLAGLAAYRWQLPAWFVAAGLLAFIAVVIPRALMMANQWENAVVLRLGKLHAIRGPGLFLIVPFVDAVATWIDQRIQTTEFNAEPTPTQDNPPVHVDGIVLLQVHHTEHA